MRKPVVVLATACGLALPCLSPAQVALASPPPKVLQIYREVVKPGHGPAHQKVEAGWPAAFARAKRNNHYLAISSWTGPGEAWFLSGWDSFSAFEKEALEHEADAVLRAELARLGSEDGEHLSQLVSMLAAYREDLSYRPAIRIPEMRYFSVTTFRVKPGRSAEFVAARKMVQALHEKLNMDEHWATYQVVSGAPAGTYLMFIPSKSMAEMDASQEMHGKAYQDAMGEEGQKKLGDFMNASLDSSTSMLFAFSPGMSYPAQEWVAADPFWAPKVERAAKAPATGKVPARKTTKEN